MNDFGSGDVNLQSRGSLLFQLVGNAGSIDFLTIAYDAAIEVILVHLEQSVVPVILIIENPLHAVALEQGSSEDERAGCRRGAIEYKPRPTVDEPAFFRFPGTRILPLGHSAGRQGQVEFVGFPGNNVYLRRANQTVRGFGGKCVRTSGQIESSSIADLHRSFSALGDGHGGIRRRKGHSQLAEGCVESRL